MEEKGEYRHGRKETYLDGAIAWACTRKESAAAFIRRVQAGARATAGAAGFLDAALDVGCAGAVVGEVEALGCALGGWEAGACAVLWIERGVSDGRIERVNGNGGMRVWKPARLTGVEHDCARASRGKGISASAAAMLTVENNNRNEVVRCMVVADIQRYYCFASLDCDR